MAYPIPINEQERINNLLQYNILDTSPEEKFDELVRLASQICNTPISLVSLIDHERQWFKAKVGLTVDETHREQAFCAHAIMDDKPFIVSDATQDERFANNPLVTGSPDIRFYAGIPLKSPAGFNLGTLCVIDQKPRELTSEQLMALQTLANQVISQMELALKVRELQGALSEVNDKNHELQKAINDLRRTQNQLIESEKMSSLGQLTAGIAHEINNPVNFISAGSQALNDILQTIINLLLRYESLDACAHEERKKIMNEIVSLKMGLETTELVDDAKHMMADIETGVTRTTEIVQSLLAFASNDVDNKELLDVNVGINAALTLYKAQFAQKNITVKTHFGDLPPIQAFKSLLNRVFMNLLNNAIDAAGEHGEIVITTENLIDEIKISIEDSGSGIPEAHLSKIFEPFYTTKPVGNGTGLGLSVSFGIIKKHHGSIEVKNVEGNGARFMIYLPK
ncbi:MAG: ATP-binding protein [Flammeovirgaceae bacterium]